MTGAIIVSQTDPLLEMERQVLELFIECYQSGFEQGRGVSGGEISVSEVNEGTITSLFFEWFEDRFGNALILEIPARLTLRREK